MSRFLKRLLKKDDEEEGTDEDEVTETETTEEMEEATQTPEVMEEEVVEEVEEQEEEVVKEEVTMGGAETVPYHSDIKDRLMFMFNDPTIGADIEGTDEFYIEFMAMGERFWIGKAPLGDIELKTGSITDQDAHIRIANDVVADLLSAATFDEFSKIYLKYYKNAEAGKFVKIEVRKPITNLNRRGYARVPIMKLLIGSAR